jgi:hypothetical protein
MLWSRSWLCRARTPPLRPCAFWSSGHGTTALGTNKDDRVSGTGCTSMSTQGRQNSHKNHSLAGLVRVRRVRPLARNLASPAEVAGEHERRLGRLLRLPRAPPGRGRGLRTERDLLPLRCRGLHVGCAGDTAVDGREPSGGLAGARSAVRHHERGEPLRQAVRGRDCADRLGRDEGCLTCGRAGCERGRESGRGDGCRCGGCNRRRCRCGREGHHGCVG